HPASKARVILDSDSVGGADESRNGFSNLIPVKLTDLSTLIQPPNRYHYRTQRTLYAGLSIPPQRTPYSVKTSSWFHSLDSISLSTSSPVSRIRSSLCP